MILSRNSFTAPVRSQHKISFSDTSEKELHMHIGRLAATLVIALLLHTLS